jgi:MFS family permease
VEQAHAAARYSAGVDRDDRRRTPPDRLPREVRGLVGVGFVVALGYGIVAPALPTFARSFDVGLTAASTVVSVFAVVRIAFAPVSGRLVGRLGELRVFCGGLVVVALSSAACAAAGSFLQLLAFRAAGGVGSTMFTVATASLIVRLAPPSLRGRATGAWAGGFLLGTIAGPVAGGGLAAVSLRAPFLVYAGVLMVATVVAGGLLRGRAGPHTPDRSGSPVTFGTLLRHRSFRAALLSNVLNGWTVYGVRVALVPLYVIEELRQPSTWSGFALTAFAVGTAAALPIGGRWSDRSGRRPAAAAGSAVVAVTALWLGFATTLTGLVAAALLSGVGTGLMSPAVNASVGDLLTTRDHDADGGPVLAGFQLVGDLGSVVGPVVAALVVERSGYAAGFATVSVIATASLIAWLRAPETWSR